MSNTQRSTLNRREEYILHSNNLSSEILVESQVYVRVSIFAFVLIEHVFVDFVVRDHCELLSLRAFVSWIFASPHENIWLIDNNYKFDEIDVQLRNLHLLDRQNQPSEKIERKILQ